MLLMLKFKIDEMLCIVMLDVEKAEEHDPETRYKESFRVFGTDEE